MVVVDGGWLLRAQARREDPIQSVSRYCVPRGSLPVTFNTGVNEADVVLIVQILSDFLGDLDELLEGVRD